MSETTFYFGRINFKHQLSGLDDFGTQKSFDKGEKISSLLHNYVSADEPVHSEDESIWRFGDVELSEGCIYGKFGKVFTDKPMQFDEEEGDFVESQEEKELADVSHFMIFTERNMIAFNRKKHIGHKQFINAFAEGYNQYHNIVDGIKIRLLKSSVEIKDLLSRADRIFSIDFDLIPTNPIRDEDMRILDQPMRDMGADELSIAAESDGSIDTESDIVRSGFSLSNNGYGDFRLGYEESNESKIYDSREKPATYEATEPESIGGLRSLTEDLSTQLTELTIDKDSSDVESVG
jgi:hypothetical protein